MAAGVSKSTVSRAFKKDRTCQSETRRKILQIAARLGYSPSPIASSLTTNSTRLIGIVVENLKNPVFLEVFEHFTRELQQRQYGALIVNLDSGVQPKQAADMLMRYNIDGAFIASSTLPETFASTVRARDIPIVHAFGREFLDHDVSVVGIDNSHCGVLAATVLQNHGLKKVALVAGPAGSKSATERASGFISTCDSAGLDITSIIQAESHSHEAGRRAMADLLDRKVEMEVVFCADHLTCMGAMDHTRGTGISVPDEVGFISVNDMKMTHLASGDLATVQQPVEAIILNSIELMLSLLNSESSPKHVRVRPVATAGQRSLGCNPLF